MLFYCRQRGMSAEEATALVVNGFVKDVLQQLRWNSRSRHRNSSQSVWRGARMSEDIKKLKAGRWLALDKTSRRVNC